MSKKIDKCQFCGGSGAEAYGDYETQVCYYCGGTGEHREEHYTRNECSIKDTCQFAFDLYSTNGDCLAEK